MQNIGSVTKWLRLLSLDGNDKIRNRLVANLVISLCIKKLPIIMKRRYVSCYQMACDLDTYLVEWQR